MAIVVIRRIIAFSFSENLELVVMRNIKAKHKGKITAHLTEAAKPKNKPESAILSTSLSLM